MDVYDYAKKLAFLSPTTLSEESLAIAALFHDVCKVNFYTTEYRNKKIDGVWQEIPFYTVDERYHFGGHGSKSVYQIQYFMKLTPEEAAAINCHMGFSDGNAGTVRFRLTTDTLGFGYNLPAAGRSRDFHPLERALAGRTNNSRGACLRGYY